jgi:DNA repair exonuclease SbcCD nuclease subunit
MKILFTADWHIKLDQKNVPKQWQINRYKDLFAKIEHLARKYEVNQVVVGGDIFDKIPSMEELELFFNFLSYPHDKYLIVLYDGNHEATTKGKTFLHNLAGIIARVHKNAMVLEKPFTIRGIDYIPYTHIKSFNPKDFSSPILCTHVRGEIPPHVLPEIDLKLLENWKVVLAGDLHSYSNSQKNILYPGSPLSTSFHRNKVNNGIIIFDTDTLEHEWIDLKLPQLLRKTISSKEKTIQTDYDHTIFEVIGNINELNNIIIGNNNIDKKIVYKESNKQLDLSNKSIAEELEIYLKEIQKLSDSDITNVLRVFSEAYNDNI